MIPTLSALMGVLLELKFDMLLLVKTMFLRLIYVFEIIKKDDIIKCVVIINKNKNKYF